MGFRGALCEGADNLLDGRTPNALYQPPGTRRLKLLLRNYKLSDDIAFRFANQQWADWPLTAAKFAKWMNREEANGEVVNLFLDYETLGEHQWADTGIFRFLERLPGELFKHRHNRFLTPSEVLDRYPAADEYDVPHMSSWADTERDLSAWLGNAMQSNALHEVYRMEKEIKSLGDPQLLQVWRKMQTSDHFYYMCTKYFADGDVHKYFNPYDSPYDSYINYMNVMENLRNRLKARKEKSSARRRLA
jgi:alpha-amylase